MSKPTVRKFKHGEVVGVVKDELLLELIDRLCDAYTAAWTLVGKQIGINPYDPRKPNGTPRDFALNSITGEVLYLGRTQK